ncbi:MAG TPA: GNAT family N-acetyltransferase [Gammaproteobacteria bacterium]|nr:GNAT family N-acetyltransferase [Gammaproteobacteria bacterium]
MKVRPGQVEDALGIATVHVRGWQAAYPSIVPAHDLSSLSIDEAVSWRAELASAPPEIWVAEESEGVIGWIAFGPSRDADAAADTGEVEAVYVSPEHWSTGTGRALWLTARRRLQESGFRRATLWVLADNERAIRFYRAAGFAPSVERSVEIAGKALAEIRYEMPLG